MKKYNNEKCSELKDNGKWLWQIIRKVTNSQNDKSSIVDCLEIHQIKCYKLRLIAEEFASFFSTVGKTYSDVIPNSWKSISEYMNRMNQSTNSMFLSPTTEWEISKIIQALKSKNSHGYDGISNKLIKEIRPALCRPLALLFNLSLRNGIFPDSYKKGGCSTII